MTQQIFKDGIAAANSMESEYNDAKKYFTDLTNQLFKKYNGVTDGYLQELKATAANVLKNKPAGWQVAWDEFNETE